MMKAYRHASLGIALTLTAAIARAGAAPPVAIPDPEVWSPPLIRPEGFQFEVQISSTGAAFDRDRLRASIEAHDLGEHESAVAKVFAPEWGYSFTHLDGQIDGAGREIEAGYPTPPADRAECLRVIETFLHRQYIRGAARPWASMNGHFPWHHYAAEFGFDQIGSEIGENINNYQWHIALNRGAARQYRKPWFVDFSAWHGPSITDYSADRIWGEHSGPDHGHSMSLFERSLFISYMAGAGQITAEAGGAIAFLPELDDEGRYTLSPYGEVCMRFRRFTQAYPDVGLPYTPFALVLDYFHGAYPGFGERKAFAYFDYTPGDDMTWNLVDMIWPGGWEIMGKRESGTLVNGPYGDTFDAILQNAPQPVLDSYPCLILTGAIRLKPEERARLMAYAERGGTLIVNTVYLAQLPDLGFDRNGAAVAERPFGNGRVIVYGPDHDVTALDNVIRKELAHLLPVAITPGVGYLVNAATDGIYLTLVNNQGVTKEPRQPAKVDPAAAVTAILSPRAERTFAAVKELTGRAVQVSDSEITVALGPGELCVLHIRFAPE